MNVENIVMNTIKKIYEKNTWQGEHLRCTIFLQIYLLFSNSSICSDMSKVPKFC